MATKSGDIAYRMIRTALQVLARIPRRQIGRLAYPLGRIWYGLDHYHRKIAIDNLSIAFGREFTPAEIRSLARKNFIQLVRVGLEIPSLLRLSKNNIDTYVEFRGQEHLEAALAQGTGVLVLTAHLGNWELMALAAAVKFGMPFLRPGAAARLFADGSCPDGDQEPNGQPGVGQGQKCCRSQRPAA